MFVSSVTVLAFIGIFLHVLQYQMSGDTIDKRKLQMAHRNIVAANICTTRLPFSRRPTSRLLIESQTLTI